MAQRNLPQSTFRQVTDVVAESSGSLKGLVDAGRAILEQNEQAKMASGYSNLQADLSMLELETKNQFSLDPKAGVSEFKKKRQKLIDDYSKEISPLYRGTWNDSISGLVETGNASQEKWMYMQSRSNSVDFVNETIKNNMNQAITDGMNASGGEGDIDALANMANSYANIERYAVNNLGDASAQSVLKNYKDDYMKSFVSGVGHNDPVRALGLLDDDLVKDSFGDKAQYMKMKNSMEVRVKRKTKADAQMRDANIMQGTNALSSTIQGMSYAEIQQTFDNMGVSDAAQDFYMEASGYTEKKRALTSGEKSDLKNKFFSSMSKFIESEGTSNADIQAFQDIVYKSMSKGALTKTEGFTFLNAMIDPLLEDQKARADQFQTGAWNPFQGNLGLDSLNEEIEKVSGAEFFALNADGDIKSKEQKFNLNKNANLMYEVYLQTLGKEAEQRGVSLDKLGSLGRAEEVEIYNKALNAAKSAFTMSSFPEAPKGTNVVVQPIQDMSAIDAEIAKLEKELGINGK